MLSEGKDTPVFGKAMNPWISSILSLMLEVYNMEHLKVTLKFDVEQLLKLLNVSLDGIARTDVLTSVERSQGEGNPDFKEYSGDRYVVLGDRTMTCCCDVD